MKRIIETEKYLPVFRKRLRELRGKMTQKEVAAELSISRASLGFYEEGSRKPDIAVLLKIADFYNVSCDYLLGLTDGKGRKDMGKETQCMNCAHFDENEGNCRNCLAPIYDENGRCKEYEAKADPDRWIPVSKRRPKPDETVIVTVVDPDTSAKVFSEEATYMGKKWTNAYGDSLMVVAWRPFPKPYKKKELMELMGFETEEER